MEKSTKDATGVFTNTRGNKHLQRGKISGKNTWGHVGKTLKGKDRKRTRSGSRGKEGTAECCLEFKVERELAKLSGRTRDRKRAYCRMQMGLLRPTKEGIE